MRTSGSSHAARLRLAVIVAIAVLVTGLENDDLVFDHESKLPIADIVSEQENRESLFHSIWNWLNFDNTDTFSSSQYRSGQFDKSLDTNLVFNIDNRRKRDVKEDNGISSDDTSYKSKKHLHKNDKSIQPKLPLKFQEGDDEDDLGSGELEVEREVEGSAISVDFHMIRTTPVDHKNAVTELNLVDEINNYDEKNVYRISMTIKEPYQKEFEKKNSEKFQKFAEKLTNTIKEIIHKNSKKDLHVTFVKMENAPDPFESYVHLDIHTMNSESDVRHILVKHLNTYYSFGKFTVNPLTFRLRVVLECQHGEIACDVSRCILQTQRCDFKSDCEDGSDEVNCKYPKLAGNHSGGEEKADW